MKAKALAALKSFYHYLKRSPLSPVLKRIYEFLVLCEYRLCCMVWRLRAEKETAEAKRSVVENITFIYKSFERQGMAKRLYRSIQRYYPGARVIICDDSREPLKMDGPQIIYLPFNSGLGAGMKALLAAVETPYTMRMDDDELLTPLSAISEQLAFLRLHENVDLCGVQAMPCRITKPELLAKEYSRFTMSGTGRKPIVPLGTRMDERHIVMGKVANVFLARTDSLRKLGYDENIRMIDHHEFFFRAMGVLTCVTDEKAFVFHYHNRFDSHYAQYRGDTKGDSAYIRMKHAAKKYN